MRGTSRRPKVGLMLPMFTRTADRALQGAREADVLGFDGVFGFDHLFPIGGPTDGPALECFTTLAAAGAVTTRVAVGTLVTRVSLRPAGLLAKLAAALDEVSGGRAIIGVGTGDRLSESEHRVYGFPVEAHQVRIERLLETVRAVRSLLSGEPYGGGELVPGVEGPLLPPPVREGGPPLWCGGASDAVVRIAAAVGDGWNGWGLSPDAFGRKVNLLYDLAGGRRVDPTWGGIVLVGEDEAEADRLAAARGAAGRQPATFTGSADRLSEHLGVLAGAGAEWCVLLLAGPADRRALVAERVLPLLGG